LLLAERTGLCDCENKGSRPRGMSIGISRWATGIPIGISPWATGIPIGISPWSTGIPIGTGDRSAIIPAFASNDGRALCKRRLYDFVFLFLKFLFFFVRRIYLYIYTNIKN